MNGTAATSATTMHDQTGVCRCGLTLDSAFEPGSCPSRDIPNASRTVEVMIDMQHTKIAADTTSRYTVAKAAEKFASMTVWAPTARLSPAFFMPASPPGTAISVPQ